MEAIKAVAGFGGDGYGVGEKRLERFHCIDAADDVDFVEDEEDLFFAAADVFKCFFDGFDLFERVGV